jgi:hypothetical protein
MRSRTNSCLVNCSTLYAQLAPLRSDMRLELGSKGSLSKRHSCHVKPIKSLSRSPWLPFKGPFNSYKKEDGMHDGTQIIRPPLLILH